MARRAGLACFWFQFLSSDTVNAAKSQMLHRCDTGMQGIAKWSSNDDTQL